MFRMNAEDAHDYLEQLDAMADADPAFALLINGMRDAIGSVDAQFSEVLPLAVKVNGVLTGGLGIIDQTTGADIRIIGIVPPPGMIVEEMIITNGGCARHIDLKGGQTLADVSIVDH